MQKCLELVKNSGVLLQGRKSIGCSSKLLFNDKQEKWENLALVIVPAKE